jgi:hypothetical protein
MANNLNLENPLNPNQWNRQAGIPNQRAVGTVRWEVPVGTGRTYMSNPRTLISLYPQFT